MKLLKQTKQREYLLPRYVKKHESGYVTGAHVFWDGQRFVITEWDELYVDGKEVMADINGRPYISLLVKKDSNNANP